MVKVCMGKSRHLAIKGLESVGSPKSNDSGWGYQKALSVQKHRDNFGQKTVSFRSGFKSIANSNAKGGKVMPSLIPIPPDWKRMADLKECLT